jgi:hypothetical protein
LEEIGPAAADHGLALCPHILGPIPGDDFSRSELGIEPFGIFNAGLIAVGSSAADFLNWWAGRLARDCVEDLAANLYVDQRPLDWIPIFFPHLVLRDPTLNVAYWNLHERPVTEGVHGYEVHGKPLRLFHFSGFAPERPDLLTNRSRDPALTLDRHPALNRLCAEYAAKVMSAGHSSIRNRGYDFGVTAGGQQLTRRDRRVYRAAVINAERSDAELPPSPFDPARADDFVSLLTLATDDWLPLGVRARLAQLRNARTQQSGRAVPTFARRTLLETKWALGEVLKTRRSRRRQTDAVLVDLLFDLERRLGTPVTFTDEQIISSVPPP